MDDSWCILRTKGSSTLRLARSLADAGLNVWTPIEYQTRKSHRDGARTEVAISVMPTYVFAHATHLIDLLTEADAHFSAHPSFSVFRYADRFPLIRDKHLAGLRTIERKAAAENKPVVFPRNEEVRVPDGPFQGLTGRVVEDSKGKHTLVAFPGCNFPIEFASWQLEKAA